MKPRTTTQVIGQVRYNTETAALLAGDDYFDGHNFERSGRNTFLFRGKNGRHFVLHQTQWQGERDSIEPLEDDEALAMFESLEEKRLTIEEAFPGVTIQEA